MNHDEMIPILQNAFGDDLEQIALTRLFETANECHYDANAVICKQGEIGHILYILAEGQVIVQQAWDEGVIRNLKILQPGDFFGELALIDNTPRMASCTAVTDVVVLEISEQLFDHLVVHSPVVASCILRRVMFSLRRQENLALADLRAKNADLRQAYSELQEAQNELVKMERLEREIELAAEVQRSLLPAQLPQIPHYQFAAYLQPARMVGGDMYDVLQIDDDHIGLLLADVADKGVHAALFMAVTRTLFHREAQCSLSPAAVTLAVHEGLLSVAERSDLFVTAFYGVLHLPTGKLTYVRAAQERPLLLHADHTVETLPGDGRFLGMLPGLDLEEQSITLQKGDRLILFSDGVSDAINDNDENYGYDRLQNELGYCTQTSAAGITAHIVANVAQWVQGAPAFDDLTLLTVAVTD